MKKSLIKILSVVVCMALSLSFLAACSSDASSSGSESAKSSDAAKSTEQPKSVKLILYASITGSGSTSGQMLSRAAKVAVDYVNENGGIKSLGGAKVELVTVDSGSDPSAAALPLQRALQQNPDAVAVIGHATSSICLVELQVLQESGILGLTTSASNSKISTSGCEWVFQPAPYAEDFGAMQIEFLKYLCDNYLHKDFSQLKMGLVYENSAWGTQNAEGTIATLKSSNQKVTVDEPYEAGSLTDATSIITKMKNANVDVIFPSCYENDAKIIMTACQALNYKPIFVGGGSAFTWPSLRRDLGDLVNGIFSTDNFVNDQSYATKNKTFAEIQKKYESTYNEFLSGQGGPTALCTMLAIEAIEETGSIDRTKVRDKIFSYTSANSIWMASFNGKDNSVDENGHNKGSAPIVLQWQNGRPTCVYPKESANSEILDPNTLKPYAK